MFESLDIDDLKHILLWFDEVASSNSKTLSSSDKRTMAKIQMMMVLKEADEEKVSQYVK